MLKKLLFGVCVGGSFSLLSPYAATAAERPAAERPAEKCPAEKCPVEGCLRGCKNSITREDLEKCQAGCRDGASSTSVSISGINTEVEDRSMRRKENPNSR